MTQQQLPITTDKSTLTTKETLIIVSITSFTTKPTQNVITTTNDNGKRMIIGNLIKTKINRLTTTSIKRCTTILNMIIINMVFATLVNDLKMVYLIIIEWNRVSEVHGLCQMGTITINGID